MASGMTFMQRRKGSGIYEFRRRLPKELAGNVVPLWLLANPELSPLINPANSCFKREITVSLQTTDKSLAKRRDLTEAKKALDLFELASSLIAKGREPDAPAPLDLANRHELSPEAIKRYVIRKILSEDELEREEGDARQHHQTRQERAQWPDLTDARLNDFGMADGHLEVMAQEIELLANDFRQAYAQRRIDIIKPELHAYLTENKILIDPSSSEYRKAGLAWLEGCVEAYALLEDRQGGKVVKTPPEAQPQASTKQQVGVGPKLSEAYQHWRKGGSGRGAKQPGANSIREAERTVRYFIEWHGDLALGGITKPMVREFRDDGLSKLRTRLPAKVRKLPLRKLVAAKEVVGSEPIHANSINKYLNLLSAIFATAERDGLMDNVSGGYVNPFSRMGVQRDKREASSKRLPFSDEHLQHMFSDKVFRAGYRPRAGGGEAAFWFPLIGLLTGARLNEITQLRLKDIQKDQQSGVWFMDINTDGGKQVKTITAVRKVPLHAELIRLGLLHYRNALLARKGAKETDKLWPEVQSEDGEYSATAFTKWFGRYLRVSLKITEKSIVFHSFRHSFKRLCRDGALSEELHDALTGHSGSSSVGRGYGDGFGLKAMAEGIEKLTVPHIIKTIPEWQAHRIDSRETLKRKPKSID
jgi:integrase